jgi:hypothetical protein
MGRLLRHIKSLWMRFAHTLGKINTFVFLSLFYIIVIGIISLFYRASHLLKKHDIEWEKKSVWDPTIEWSSHEF